MARGLTVSERAAWRAWITAASVVPDLLGRDLQTAHGITLADYDILVHLSEATNGELRMSELARRTLVSRSRLTHQIDRMEAAGYVERRDCYRDGRGLLAVLTESGRDLLRSASQTHSASIRRHVVDLLSREELACLGAASAKLVEGASTDAAVSL